MEANVSSNAILFGRLRLESGLGEGVSFLCSSDLIPDVWSKEVGLSARSLPVLVSTVVVLSAKVDLDKSELILLLLLPPSSWTSHKLNKDNN